MGLAATFWNDPVARFPRAPATDYHNKNVVPTCRWSSSSQWSECCTAKIHFSEHLFPICIHKDYLLLQISFEDIRGSQYFTESDPGWKNELDLRLLIKWTIITLKFLNKMQISDRNIFMPKGKNSDYKGYWTSMFIGFIQESNDLGIASFLLYSYLCGQSLWHRGNRCKPI